MLYLDSAWEKCFKRNFVCVSRPKLHHAKRRVGAQQHNTLDAGKLSLLHNGIASYGLSELYQTGRFSTGRKCQFQLAFYYIRLGEVEARRTGVVLT